MSLGNDDITAKNFKTFYDGIRPYLGSYDKGKLTFVGEVKAFFAETAPNGFLICDGATYNKADYPQLANLLLSLTDHSAYEVSGDDTKFKVPDLRGEFLRGSGTNSHANQGSGAGVGVHQDGTEQFHPICDGTQLQFNLSSNDTNGVLNPDYMKARTKWVAAPSGSSGSTVNDNGSFTSRPTNTSVLYCIAYKDTMVDLDFLSYGGERFAKSDMYDTNERVIGKWIDGKPLYQKTVSGKSASSSTWATIGTMNSGEVVVGYREFTLVSKSGEIYALSGSSNYGFLLKVDTNNNIIVYTQATDFYNCDVSVTIRYTKTTDTADSFKYSTPTDYSTEEKIVGTWIDGKPVYQKTVEFENKGTNDTQLSFGTGIDIHKYDGFLLNNADKVPITGYIWGADIEHCYSYIKDGNTIVLNVKQFANKKVVVTVQYTKTTDV